MNSASSPLQKLEKVLFLERNLGYTDRAVIGGLARFVSYWADEARQSTPDPNLARLIDETAALLQSYSEETTPRRREMVQEALGMWEGVDMPAQEEKQEVSGSRPQQRPAAENKQARTSLSSPVTELRGVSEAYARRLSRLGVKTIQDLLYLFPNRYDDYSALKTIDKLQYGDEVTIIGTVRETQERTSKRGQNIVSSTVSDGTGAVQATWFNQPYLVRQLKVGRRIVISGRVDQYLGHITFSSPTWEPLDEELIHTARIVPVYPLTRGLTARWLRRLAKKTTDYWSLRLPDHLPPAIKEQRGLLELELAIRRMHFPENWEALEAARRRLAFDELLLIQLGVLRQRRDWRARSARPVRVDGHLLRAFLESLPYSLTPAQERALSQILDDLQQPRPMSRLLQGDVGSGKTVVAAAAMLATAASGLQAVLMVPTEILAEQHYANLEGLWGELWLPGLKKLSSELRLLTG
ncbi:MAG: DEAD/DEAH box helicase, partial [Anaerolineae bacterium]|nr:DEAD/DEAH box helicase [Anaerolineae bacterium]